MEKNECSLEQAKWCQERDRLWALEEGAGRLGEQPEQRHRGWGFLGLIGVKRAPLWWSPKVCVRKETLGQ